MCFIKILGRYLQYLNVGREKSWQSITSINALIFITINISQISIRVIALLQQQFRALANCRFEARPIYPIRSSLPTPLS